MRPIAFCLTTALLGAASFPAAALNIVLSNDDGLTANTKALYTKLKAAGHDVVVSVPCQNQSGKGASMDFLVPITPLTKACVGGAATAGAAGVGAISGMTDFYYVNGSPVMATLYGLDVLAVARWGKAPDLVISGPNEGQNVGPIVISSGTVSNAQVALSRGLPAIAFSADTNTTGNDTLAAEVADLSVKFVAALQAKAGAGRLLPEGVAPARSPPARRRGSSSPR